MIAFDWGCWKSRRTIGISIGRGAPDLDPDPARYPVF